MDLNKQNLLIAEFLDTHKVSREMASWNKPRVPEENIYVVTDKNGKQARYWTETVVAEMYDNDYIHVTRYNSDLNAMHEAEKTLTDKQYELFTLHLGPLTSQRKREYISSTASQRAEAFLRTIGKWEN